MGIPSDPAEYSGSNCDYFTSGYTPKTVWASIGGIQNGDWEPVDGWMAPNGIWTLKQDGVQPCSWECYAGGRAISYSIKTPNASLTATDYDRNAAFYGGPSAAGTTFFTANAQSPVNNYYYGGIAQIMWLPTIMNPSLLLALEELSMIPGPKTFLEFFPVEAGIISVKACRLSDKTNISFKFSY